jgi:hypothetical protein
MPPKPAEMLILVFFASWLRARAVSRFCSTQNVLRADERNGLLPRLRNTFFVLARIFFRLKPYSPWAHPNKTTQK